MTRQQPPATSDLANRPAAGGVTSTSARTVSYVPPLTTPPPEPHLAPARPPLREKAPAPVLAKAKPPFSVRASEFLWGLSLLVGAAGVVYAFIIRAAQLPAVEKLIKGVEAHRAAATYDSAAQIAFWCVFGGMIAVVFAQVILFVSFRNRRPNVRWWQFATFFLQAVVIAFAHELIAMGERGKPLEIILAGQYGLAILAFLVGLLPPALHWTARKYDIRRG